MSQQHAHGHDWKEYYLIFNALIFLTVVTVGLSYFDLGLIMSDGLALARTKAPFLPDIEFGHGPNIVIGMIVAIIKASLVLWFFMHQKDEEGVNRFTVAFSIGLLVLAFVIFCTDFVFLGTYAGEIAGAALGTH